MAGIYGKGTNDQTRRKDAVCRWRAKLPTWNSRTIRQIGDSSKICTSWNEPNRWPWPRWSTEGYNQGRGWGIARWRVDTNNPNQIKKENIDYKFSEKLILRSLGQVKMSDTGLQGTESVNSDQLHFGSALLIKDQCPKFSRSLPILALKFDPRKLIIKVEKNLWAHVANHFSSMSNVGVILGQNVFSPIRRLEYKSGGPSDPCEFKLCWVGLQVDHYPEK